MADQKLTELPTGTAVDANTRLYAVANAFTTPTSEQIPAPNFAGLVIDGATSKATPVDADEIGLWDSIANAFKKLTWANLKATLFGSEVTFGTFITLTRTSATIASDAITANAGWMLVDTEGGAATDNLSTINGYALGRLLIIQSTNAARDIVVKDGTGNLALAGDCTLGTPTDKLTLIGTATGWQELARSINT